MLLDYVNNKLLVLYITDSTEGYIYGFILHNLYSSIQIVHPLHIISYVKILKFMLYVYLAQ